MNKVKNKIKKVLDSTKKTLKRIKTEHLIAK